jgi:hypothetical protein
MRNVYCETVSAIMTGVRSPKVILQKLRSLENEIIADLDALEGMLG